MVRPVFEQFKSSGGRIDTFGVFTDGIKAICVHNTKGNHRHVFGRGLKYHVSSQHSEPASINWQVVLYAILGRKISDGMVGCWFGHWFYSNGQSQPSRDKFISGLVV